MYKIRENFEYTRSFGYIRTLHIFITVFAQMQNNCPKTHLPKENVFIQI